MPELTAIPLSDLALGDRNPRSTEPTAAEVAALAASVGEIGLQQNLIGYPAPATGAAGKVLVAGGGLRLRALRQLAAAGRLDAAAPIPVMLHEGPDEAAAAAVAENEARLQMSASDTYRAVARLREAGRSRAQIAAALALDEPGVARILALDRAAPEILDALASGRLTLDQARAFTIGQRGQQVALLDRFEEPGHSPWYERPEAIRTSLRAAAGGERLARRLDVVGRAAYEAAGGTFTRDLFSEFVTTDHPEIVDRLFAAHVEARLAQALAEGWSWASFHEEGERVDYPAELEGAEAEETEAEAAFLAEHGNEPREGEPEEIARRREGILDRLEMGAFSPDQQSVSGVAIVLSHGGLLSYFGLVREQDLGRAKELGLLGPAEGEPGTAGGGVEPPAGAVSAALAGELASVRAVAIAEAVAADAELALDVLDWLVPRPPWPMLTTIRIGRGNLDAASALGVECWVSEPQRRLSTEEPPPFRRAGTAPLRRARNARLARWLASTLVAGRTDGEKGDGWEEVTAAASIHVRDRWTPDAVFLERLTMAQLGQLWRELAGDDASLEAELLATPGRKPDAVAFLAAVFAKVSLSPPEGGVDRNADEAKPAAQALPDDFAVRVRHWLPEPIREGAE